MADYYGGSIDSANIAQSQAKMEISQRRNTDRSRLEQKKQYIETELKKVNDALEMLDAHPDLEQFMVVVSQGLDR